MTRTVTGGQAIVDAISAHNVDTVFALPGVQTYPLMDALKKAENSIRVIGPRHEQAAAYMAMGYARATGRPGVFSVVPGPGVLNTGAALCTAVAVNAPLLLLTGEVPSPFLGQGRGHLHEIPDQRATLASFIKWAERIPNATAARPLVDEAFQRMQAGRPGPVALEMCWDTMAQTAPVVDRVAPALSCDAPADPSMIDRAVDLLRDAKRPMIMVGSGAQHAGAEVRALAEMLDAPVTAFRGGRGILPADHPLCVNSVEAYELWRDTDLLIGIGSRCELQAMRWRGMMDASDRLAPPRKLIRIEIEPEELLRLKPDVGIVCDAATGAGVLGDALSREGISKTGNRQRIARAREKGAELVNGVQPQVSYLEVIRQALPRDGILVKDMCQAGYASYFAWPVYEPRTYITSGYQGNLGYAYPTALGAKVGRPDRPVVAILGDGGLMFAAAELSTAAQHGIGVVAIVFNNRAYGNVRRDQITNFSGRTVASDLPGVDYVKLAEANGVKGYLASSPSELAPLLEQAIAADVPALIEVRVDPDEEVSPWPLIVRPDVPYSGD
ncbi:thiamine pyrophosphate-dependent enzyme [Lutimaribacter saemankumensis]|uniref:Acetolactate synthase-1/2/3 large subunit n=1 Tax=Lutimaribacter saemankumensis TaxID=490829 RepID=A0A1G8TKF6_9RHOB|nr:thiamine pyrophosphate-dependent enzyme [Lutimaribacter saemankumensis]SDJ41395.1 acetolactate synthase-1/2/3 large subunit [Lutimaribacter saemankumensis]